MTNTAPVYEAFALRYATTDRLASQTFLTWKGPDRPIRLDFFFWALRTGERTIVIDTGFSPFSSEKRRRPYLHRPADLLRRIGIAPEQVGDVILTHLHYDHVGNLADFPAATFHVQAREVAAAIGPDMAHPLLRAHYEARDLATLVHLIHEGRVRFHDSTSEVAPGVRVHLVPGHTSGLQAVEVATITGPLVIASDAVHYYANLEQDNPFPALVDVAGELNAFRRLSALAGSLARLVPGHDPQVLARFAPHPDGGSDVVCLA